MFKEIAPYVIVATLIICAVIAIKIKKEDILTTDGIFSVVGFMLGLIITSLNLIYSNNYMISLGPLLAIACLLYLRFRTKILTSSTDFNLNFSSKTKSSVCSNSHPFATDSPSRIRPIGLSIRSGRIAPSAMNE